MYLDLFYNAGEVRKQDTVTNSSGQRMEQNSPKTWTMFPKSWKNSNQTLLWLVPGKKLNFLSLEKRSNVRLCFCHAHVDMNSAGKRIQISLVRFQASQQTEAETTVYGKLCADALLFFS